MAEENNAAAQPTSTEVTSPESKGKGKAVAEEVPGNAGAGQMEEDDDSSDEEPTAGDGADDDDEGDDDNMEEIDQENIIPSGRRTRGKDIDFAKAAADLDEDMDEDEDEDDDFVDPDQSMQE